MYIKEQYYTWRVYKLTAEQEAEAKAYHREQATEQYLQSYPMLRDSLDEEDKKDMEQDLDHWCIKEWFDDHLTDIQLVDYENEDYDFVTADTMEAL